MLESPTALGMLKTNLMLLRSALDRGAGDARLLIEGVLYVVDLEAHVAAGEIGTDVAVADASRVARALTQTGAHRERRRSPRVTPAATAPAWRREDCLLRDATADGDWYKPEDDA